MKFNIRRRYLALALALIVSIGLLFLYLSQNAVLPVPAYFLLNTIDQPTKADRVLVVSPHPDDETLGAGGYIQRALSLGAEVKVIIVTDGNKHGLKAVRHEETLRATQTLGIPSDHVIFFDYPDGNLKQFEVEFQNRLEEVIASYEPTIILSTHSADIHPDHAVVGQAVDTDSRTLKNKPIIYQFLVHYHRYPRPEGFYPSSYILPPVRLLSPTEPWLTLPLDEEEQNNKNEAVLQYRSQLSRRNPLLRGLLLSFVRKNELFVKAN
jgi:LmbE family N-acetylglucosaminyl deacetylase